MNNKRIFLSVVFILSSVTFLFAQSKNAKYQAFIDKFADLAIAEQVRHNIPASITMAQAILESNAGESRLAKQGNNHFGIKCGANWTGKTIHEDDDNPQDCFRKYNKVIDSYEDHSLFLQRPRYAFLFDYDITDYKSWAHGLKRAGYATDANYASKLIRLIELYELDQLDTQTTYTPTSKTTSSQEIAAERKERADARYPYYEESTNNGVRCLIIKKSTTTKEIAKLAGISEHKLLYINDLFEGRRLEKGDYVYLSRKKNVAESQYVTHRIVEGESMFSISQKYGIKLKRLYKINNLVYGAPAVEGMMLYLH